MTDPAPKIGAVLETAIYVDDLSRAEALLRGDARAGAYVARRANVGFRLRAGKRAAGVSARATAETLHLPGGEIPPHEGMGRLHFALAIAAADLGAWEARWPDWVLRSRRG